MLPHGRYRPVSPAPLPDTCCRIIHRCATSSWDTSWWCPHHSMRPHLLHCSTCFRGYWSSIWTISSIQKCGEIHLGHNKCYCMSTLFGWKWLGKSGPKNHENLYPNFERTFVYLVDLLPWVTKCFFCLRSGVVTERQLPEILILGGKKTNIPFSASPNYFGLETWMT